MNHRSVSAPRAHLHLSKKRMTKIIPLLLQTSRNISEGLGHKIFIGWNRK